MRAAVEAPSVSAPAHLAERIARRGPAEAVKLLEAEPADAVAEALEQVNPGVRWAVLKAMPDARRAVVLEAARTEVREHWRRNLEYPENTIGSLMDPPLGVLHPDSTIGEAVDELRKLVKRAFITYLYVTNHLGKLVGVVVMRELLLGDRSQRLEEIMLRDPFFLTPQMKLTDAMRSVLNRHFPVYPVCELDGRLVGLVRGQTLFEAQAIEISAQAGSMVGVEKEERLSTPWPRSLKFRHPWLQLNLVTAFVAAAVVGIFQDTIDEIVVLAVFLPVLAGQSGNTGCQALAVALRGMTLGELRPGREKVLVMKEAFLGLLNGGLVGITAGAGMFFYSRSQDNPDAWLLGVIVAIAMTASCVISGLSGALIPMTLKRLGADPATASSIFLTTATDVASMGIFLSLATALIR
ncbi:MAG TPA: magnesium transporter [Gemmatimonadota bacterium]|nr:magnesium transporter [Gemmatimonadota bacterium]